MAEQAKTTTKAMTGRRAATTRTYETPVATTTDDAAKAATEKLASTGSTPTATTAPVEPIAPVESVGPTAPQLPAPSPRTGVTINVDTIRTAFATGRASQSVRYVQYVLGTREFDPGSQNGVADHATRVAYARFQQSINEPPTGLPTVTSLDHLGFDVAS